MCQNAILWRKCECIIDWFDQVTKTQTSCPDFHSELVQSEVWDNYIHIHYPSLDR